MNFANPYLVIPLIGIIPAFILLIFPKLYYFVKAVLISLIAISLSWISTSLFSQSIVKRSNDYYGYIIFFSSFYGLLISLISGALVLAILIAKNDKYSRAIAQIFKHIKL